jgi:hypothetical protein
VGVAYRRRAGPRGTRLTDLATRPGADGLTGAATTLLGMGQRSDGDRLFERYLAERGIAIPEHEPDLGIGRRVDYSVVIGRHTCLCEVKEFAPTTQSVIPGSMHDLLKPIRAKIHDAAPQLKAARSLGQPLVVVLTNPNSAPVVMGEREMLWAIEGDPIVRVALASGAQAEHTVGRNGELRHDHAYITAVVVLYERLHARDYYDELAEQSRERAHDERIRAILDGRQEASEGGYLVAHTFIPGGAEAVPLPHVFFRGDRDVVWEYSYDEQRYFVVQDPQSALPRQLAR